MRLDVRRLGAAAVSLLCFYFLLEGCSRTAANRRNRRGVLCPSVRGRHAHTED